MDRFSRSLMDLKKTVEDLVTRGVSVEFVKEGLKFSRVPRTPWRS